MLRPVLPAFMKTGNRGGRARVILFFGRRSPPAVLPQDFPFSLTLLSRLLSLLFNGYMNVKTKKVNQLIVVGSRDSGRASRTAGLKMLYDTHACSVKMKPLSHFVSMGFA
mmetsp:Transcript_43854/g.86542  ORF Transcript_43854/g.86542 Transcript_43854/m.86542 type:complete len:110 (+) Transcript_43854:213-542(+)